MKVNIKKLHADAVIPKYAKQGDAGLDLVATSKSYDEQGNVVYGTGLAIEVPQGYVGLLFPRSSNTKKDLLLGNSVGILDSGYRGEVFFKFKPAQQFITDHRDALFVVDAGEEQYGPNTYQVGDRIGQIIILPYPQIEFVEVDSLSDTERGAGGFGSSGK